jgi:hypothetical protein
LDVRERRLARDFNRSELLNRIRQLYRKAPCLESAFSCIAEIIEYADDNLFEFVYHSIIRVCEYLRIDANIVISSQVPVDHRLRGEERVIAMCRALGAATYINPIGGTRLYSKESFAAKGLELKFLQPKPFVYRQFEQPFVPWLSVLDVMMFNPVLTIDQCVKANFELI